MRIGSAVVLVIGVCPQVMGGFVCWFRYGVFVRGFLIPEFINRTINDRARYKKAEGRVAVKSFDIKSRAI